MSSAPFCFFIYPIFCPPFDGGVLIQYVLDVVARTVLHFVVDVSDVHACDADGEDDEAAYEPDGQDE